MSSKLLARRAVVAAVLVLSVGFGLADSAVRTTVVLEDGDRTVIDYSFGPFESREVTIHGEPFREIRFPGEPVVLQRGAPALPHVNRSLIVPDDARMEVRVLDSEYYEVHENIAPSKGNLLRTVDPADVPYSFGKAYATSSFFPGALATLGEPYVLRDHRGIVLEIHPFQYNPVSRVLRVYTEIRVEVVTAGPGSVNRLQRDGRSARPSRAFDGLYRSHFLNYGSSYRYNPLDEEGSMLVICHDAWLANIAPFVAHKNSMGIPTTAVGVSTIGNDSTSIQAYIDSVYQSTDLAFVLLVGDIAQVDSPNSSGGASDPSYSKLAGNDDYPEILVGRFSANSAAEVDTQVQRTIDYESMPATEQDWFHRGTGIASDEGAGIGDEGQSDFVHMGQIRDWLLAGGYTHVDEIYDPGASSSQVSAALNEGRGIVNYVGHGWSGGFSTSGFNTSAVNALTNEERLPFVISVACNTGEFENYTTVFAEAWMRATHNGNPTGAIAIYASSISQSWAPPMEGQDEINLLLADPTEPYHSFGALCFAGSSSMMDDYGSAGVSMFDTWIVFGDPSLRVAGSVGPPHGMRIRPDRGLIAEGAAGGLFDPVSLQYTVENLDEQPIDWRADVLLPWASVDPAAGTLAGQSSTVVTLTLNDQARNLDNGHHVNPVEFVNLTNHDGDTGRSVSLTVGVPLLQHRWELDAFPGWTLQGKWGFGEPLGLGGDSLGYPDPASAVTGDNVFGVVLWGDYDTNSGGLYWLTSNPIDLSDAKGATLKFQRWLNTEAMPKAEARIEASPDGLDWYPIWSNDDDVADDSWRLEQFDISSVADHESSFRLRWGYGVYEDAIPCSGWNLDDVEIWGAPHSTARIELTVEQGSLSWTSVNGAQSYDVVRGDLGLLQSTAGDFEQATTGCVAGGRQEQAIGFTDLPEPGEGLWMLVRGRSSTGPMTYQALFGSQVGVRDEELEAASAACP